MLVNEARSIAPSNQRVPRSSRFTVVTLQLVGRSFVVAAAMAGSLSLAACANDPGDASVSLAPLPRETSIVTTTAPTTTVVPSTTIVPEDGKQAVERRLSLSMKIANDSLQPKSIVHSGTGLYFAQNMMYRHNVTVLDRTGAVIAQINDRVNLAEFGIDPRGKSAIVKGSPVEVAFTSDGRYAYVSNYKMYGDGWNPIADDTCQGRNWDQSFVYRIDTSTFRIDQVIPVGAVPKFLAVTPDDSTLIVSNWCSLDVSIIDLETATTFARVDVGLHPRGIAITQDSSVAYVAVMGGAKIVAITLADLSTRIIDSAGPTPRHLVLSPNDDVIYVTNNLAGTVRAIDITSGRVIKSVRSGTQPRSMSISEDGTCLYVVNYEDAALTKIDTASMKVVQSVATGYRPVGVTYDPATRSVWVANYSGSLWVFEDR
jgi:YVTN family beta-propeller protein